jgi:hypothetical protein
VHFTRTSRHGKKDGVDTELLIEAVKKFKEIWDMKCELYRDKNVKRAAWMKICEIFESSFEEKSPKEKEEIGKYSVEIPATLGMTERVGWRCNVTFVYGGIYSVEMVPQMWDFKCCAAVYWE